MRARVLAACLSIPLAAACGEAFVSDGGGATTTGAGGAATTGAGGATPTGAGGSDTGTTSTAGGGAGGAPTCAVTSECPPSASACQSPTCEGGRCLRVLAENGSPCDDGDPCTAGDACAEGACVGTKLDCSALDGPCTIGVCQGSACVAALRDDGAACDDGNPCTVEDACAAGACTGASPGCASGDGCCHPGCQGTDADCACANLAQDAVASSSPNSGQLPSYAAGNANDGHGEASCQFTWIEGGDNVDDGWLELAWKAPIAVGSVFVDTVSDAGGVCGLGAGRALLGAELQRWDDVTQAWVPLGQLGASGSDLGLTLKVPAVTTRLRLASLLFGVGGSPVVFEWRVFTAPGCT